MTILVPTTYSTYKVLFDGWGIWRSSVSTTIATILIDSLWIGIGKSVTEIFKKDSSYLKMNPSDSELPPRHGTIIRTDGIIQTTHPYLTTSRPQPSRYPRSLT